MPKHRAPTHGRSRYHEPLLAPRARRTRTAAPTHRRAAAPAPVDLEVADAEVPAATRLHRSRLAFALAVSLAALPVLVVDNMSATAETNDAQVEVTALPEDATLADLWTTLATVPATAPTTEAPTATTEAPAPTTTEAPTTTAALAVQTVAAPAPTAPPTTAPPTTAPPTTAAPAPYGDPNDPATWDRMARCESGGNWSLNSGNGYYGGLQFSVATWQSVGGIGYPHQASKAEQIKRGKILQARAGWGQWPYCARQLGYL